jgi:uncharacterized membrane protein
MEMFFERIGMLLVVFLMIIIYIFLRSIIFIFIFNFVKSSDIICVTKDSM